MIYFRRQALVWAALLFSVHAVADSPSVVPVDLDTIEEEGSRAITQEDLLQGATDGDGDDLAAENLQLISGDGVLNDLGGSWTFTPASNWFGSVELSFDVTDGTQTVPNSAMLEVTPVNDPPVVETVELSAINEDHSLEITEADLLAGVTDVEDDVLAAKDLLLITGDGVLVDNGGASWTFTPSLNWYGPVEFGFAVTDGTDAVPNTALLSVAPVNDSPVSGGAIELGTLAEDEDRAVTQTELLVGASDIDGDALTAVDLQITSGEGALSGLGTDGWTFTPAPDWYGSVVFSFAITDGKEGVSNTAALTVTSVNDNPAAADDAPSMSEDSGPLRIPVMCNDYLAETPTRITRAGIDGNSESEPTTVLNESGDAVSAPNGQVAIIEGGATCDGETVDAVEYRPKADFHGADHFTYTITDSEGDQSSATVTVTVTAVNDAPVGIQQKDYLMQENGSLVVDALSGLLVGAYDVDGALLDDDGVPVGSTLSVQVTLWPAVGTLAINQSDGTFEYTPPVNYTGVAGFEYRLTDGTASSIGDAYRVAITVLAAPEPPEPPPAGEVATIYNLANAPLEQSTSVPPNVLVVMDDSGSMDWNLIVAGEGQDGGFVLENSSRVSGRGNSTSYTYLWDLRSNAYPETSGNGRILPTDAALDADSDTNGHNYGTWRARNHLHNSLYYDPAIRYTPWVGQDAANQEFADADPISVRLDPRNPSSDSRDRINLLSGHSYRSTSVPEWDNNGGTTTVQVNNLYIPHYYRTTATPPLAWNDPNKELIEIRDGNGPFPGGPEREDCAVGDGNPLDCTYAQEIQNFANYFQYYRSREYVTKNGIGKTVSQLQDIRIGYQTISATTSEDIREMNALHTEGNKKALLDNIYRVDSYGGTPLRQALGRAGDTFACDYGRAECPALPAPEGFCQQNFALLFSDGYWNGGTGTSGNPDGDNNSVFDGGRYADGKDATLADVAMHYYENDLHSDLDDRVPLMRRDVDGVPDGVFSGADPKMHQHMKTYTIAFGVTGTVDPNDVPLNPATPFAWPNPTAGNLEKIDDMLHTAVNGRGRFLNAGSPTELQAAFESAFLEFTQAASSTSSAAFNSTSLQEGTLLYRGFYDLRDNTGKLTATLLDEDGNEVEERWDAAEQLDLLSPGARVVVTFDPASGGVPFRHGSLTADQRLTLSSDQVDYLRGVRTRETATVSPLRQRPATEGLLGDIVNSSPVFVGTPRAINRDQRPYPTDDLYSEFVDRFAERTPVVYVGANDGMLHGFDGRTGDEVFAYVPNKIIDSSQGHHNPLDLFTSPFYQHRYYVDLSPRLNDVYMRASRNAVSKSWNTVLVGGLGAGGKGLFALNVTDPGSRFSDESNASSAALWEFTDEDDTYPVDNAGVPLGGSVGAVTDPLGRPVKDMGYAVSPPVVAMSNIDAGSPARKEWVTIFGNGPNSTAGIAKLFVLFMDRGLDGWGSGDFVKLDTGFGVQSPPHSLAGYPNSLGTPAAVDTDLNGTVDRVYAGDRLGNLFRFDLCARQGDGECSSDPDDWTVTRLFTASYDSGGGTTIQPILAEPLVVKHPTERGFLVIFGTGSYLTRDDADSEDIQSIYAIWDEGGNNPATALDDTKAERLVEQSITNVVDGSLDPPVVRRIVSKNAVDYQQETAGEAGTYGWYIDLDMERASGDLTGRAPPEAQFPGERSIRRLLFRDGTVITTTVLPALDEFSCFGTRPGSILVFDAVTGGDAGRPVVDFNNDGVVDDDDLVAVGDGLYAGGVLFNQGDLEGQLVDLSTLGGQGDTDFLFVSGGDDTRAYRIANVNDNRTGRLSWRELNVNQ